MVVIDTLDFLVGTWTVERSIEDHRSGISGYFQGRAVLVGSAAEEGTAAVARASYHEAGELRYGAHVGPAWRSLEFVRLSGAVMVYFTDGRPYIDLDLRSGAWQGEHQCVADHYEVRTVVRSLDELHELWRVRGPDTDYDATTTLRRAGGPAGARQAFLLEGVCGRGARFQPASRQAGRRVNPAAQAVGVLQRPRLRRRAGSPCPPTLSTASSGPLPPSPRRWTGGSWSAPPRPGTYWLPSGACPAGGSIWQRSPPACTTPPCAPRRP
jgi:hypothetical protein